MGGAGNDKYCVNCSAQFAMLKKRIKLHGGKTVLNTIKAIRIRKGKYINSKKADQAMQNIKNCSQETKRNQTTSSELTHRKRKRKGC